MVSTLASCLATIGRANFGETWKTPGPSNRTIWNGECGWNIAFSTFGSDGHGRSAVMGRRALARSVAEV